MSVPPVPHTDFRARALAAVRNAKKPVTFKNLAKLVKAKEDTLRAELELAVDDHQLYRWPDYRGSQYFWHISWEEKAPELMLKIASDHALSKRSLVETAARKLPGVPKKTLEEIVKALVTEKQLQIVPAFNSNSKLLVRAGHREAYVHAARVFLEGKFRIAGLDSSGLFTENFLGEQDRTARRSVDASPLILEAVRELEPVRGVPVSTLRLRNHLPKLTKEDFDAAALELRKRQEVILSTHVDPYNISEEDKRLLIDGQDGTYYVAIGLR